MITMRLVKYAAKLNNVLLEVAYKASNAMCIQHFGFVDVSEDTVMLWLAMCVAFANVVTF